MDKDISKIKETLTSGKNKGAMLYLFVTGGFFLILFVLFLFFPRSVYSELEKRDLKEFPSLEQHKNHLAGYTEGISNWFSDTQPFRDNWLTLSMLVRDKLKLRLLPEDETVSFHATNNMVENDTKESDNPDEEFNFEDINIEENATVANSGIIVAGTAPNARAMMVFGGTSESGSAYIKTLNNYSQAFPGVNIYSVIAPSAGEYYMPSKVSKRNKPEEPTLTHISQNLLPEIKVVDVRSALRAHANEDIFLRTDHHWSPLGAYYAAKAFASKAGVNFKDLDSYEKHVIRDFVGSMYSYSQDIAVKKSPEDFIYYTPKNLDYSSTYITYNTNKDYKVIFASKPYESSFFKTFKDGSGNAYLTFMGGDQSLVHVKTGADSKRKLLIIKDSFGNAFPGFLFYSFSDVHVVDFRYFNKNMRKYVAENGITDIAFVFNIFNVCNSGTLSKVNHFLDQKDGELFVEPIKDTPVEKDTIEVSSQESTVPEMEPESSEENTTTVQEEPDNADPNEEETD